MRKKKLSSPYHKLVMFVLALLVLYGGYYWGNQHALREQTYLNLRPLDEPLSLTPFTLNSPSGEFTQDDLESFWNLLLIGHTTSEHSPALLSLCVQIHNRLADTPELQKRVRFLFVGIDPEERLEELKAFTSHYNPAIIPLSGEYPQISALVRSSGATFTRNEKGRIDHSTSMTLISPDQRVIGLFTGQVDAVSISHDLKTVTQQSL